MHEAAIEHLTDSDKVLARLIRRVGPCELKPRRDRSPFQALVQSVTHQQLNGTAATTILKRVIALYPRSKFPAPAALLEHGECWRPYRSIAAWYLWRALDSG